MPQSFRESTYLIDVLPARNFIKHNIMYLYILYIYRIRYICIIIFFIGVSLHAKYRFSRAQRKCKLCIVCGSTSVTVCVCVVVRVWVCICLQLSWILQLFGSCVAMCPHLFLPPSNFSTNVCGLSRSLCSRQCMCVWLLVLIWYFIHCYAIFSLVIVFALLLEHSPPSL